MYADEEILTRSAMSTVSRLPKGGWTGEKPKEREREREQGKRLIADERIQQRSLVIMYHCASWSVLTMSDLWTIRDNKVKTTRAGGGGTRAGMREDCCRAETRSHRAFARADTRYYRWSGSLITGMRRVRIHSPARPLFVDPPRKHCAPAARGRVITRRLVRRLGDTIAVARAFL